MIISCGHEATPLYREDTRTCGWGCIECGTAKPMSVICKKCGSRSSSYSQSGDDVQTVCSKHYKIDNTRLHQTRQNRKDRISNDRQAHAKDILQPFRDGDFSKEFRDAYPEQSQNMVKEGSITQSEYNNAKEVWR